VEVGEHATHVLFKQAGAEPVQVVSVCQLPDALHDCTRFPRHCVSPGAHEPEHTPSTHVWFEHAVPLVQLPFELHVCGVLPVHCTWFGAHVPVQAPATHVWLTHAAAVPHWPLAPHVSTALPEHFVVPAAHTPEQVPAMHVWSTHPPASQPVVASEVGRVTASGGTSEVTSSPPSGVAPRSAVASNAAASQSPPLQSPFEKASSPSMAAHPARAPENKVSAATAYGPRTQLQ
jgi:hypothetical protein